MNKNYPFVFWVFTILIGPLLWIIFEIIMNGQKAVSMFETLPAFIGIGLILSSPVLLLCFLIFTIFNKYTAPFLVVKLTLITVGIIGVAVTFKLIGGTLSFPLTISYSIAIIISGFISSMRLTKTETVKEIIK
jgi:hypothetical protein